MVLPGGGDEVWVVADVLGVPGESVDAGVAERVAAVGARGGRRYYGVVGLPAEVVPGPARASYKNGVLEVRLKKRGGGGKGFKVQIE